MNSIKVELDLHPNEYPDETSLIMSLVKDKKLGIFLYTVCNDMLEGRYSLEAGSQRVLLDSIVKTLGEVFDTIGAMDKNIENIVESLNINTSILSTLKGLKVESVAMEEAAVSEETVQEAVAIPIEIPISDTPMGGLEDDVPEELVLTDEIASLFPDDF